MKENQYVVLRTPRAFIPTLDNMGPMAGPVGAPAAPGSSMMMDNFAEIEVSEVSMNAAQKDDMRRDPEVQAIAPAMPLSLIEPMTDDSINPPGATPSGNTWGVDAVGASRSSFDGSGITVAVLDTGIDLSHPAFSGVNIERRNFTSEGDDDTHGHGTHCGGTIFGQDVGGTRIGVARNISKALIGKVLGQGGGSSATLANAINWAVENGANVVSMSLGIDFPGFVKQLMTQNNLAAEPATSIALEGYRANINLFGALSQMLEMRNAFGNGAMVVAASGNESKRPTYEIAVAPPAAGSGIISVGALQQGPNGLTVASFSNTQCDVSAPGVAISSAALGGGLVSWNGTSMATPHVAGVAALWAQRQLEQTGRIMSSTVRAKILGMATTNGLKAGATLNDVGNGIVQAP